MKTHFKTSLVITTYNWPEALELVLLSVKRQTLLPDEVIIADDGSKQETTALINTFKSDFPCLLQHFWHEDAGFRRTVVLNKTIAQTNSDYIIQVDGDCILHRDFVKDHIKTVKPGTYLYGSRVTLKKELLPGIFNNKTITFNFLNKGIKKRGRALHIPLFSRLYKAHSGLSNKLRGCNLSYWRKDFISVNGYNEDMTGWGRDDSELVVRMLNRGVRGKRLKFRGIMFHIYHPVKSRERLNINDTIQQQSIAEKSTWCKNGVDKYL